MGTRLCLASYVKKESLSVHQTLQEDIEHKEEAQHDGKALQKAFLFRCELHLYDKVVTQKLYHEGTRRAPEVEHSKKTQEGRY